MAKQQSTSSAQGGSFDKNLTKDIDGFHKKPNQHTHARNAVNNTVQGDLGELSNEASNYLSAAAPYTIIGGIHLGKDAWAIYSTDDTESEIGLFLEDSHSYTTAVNDPCLGFKKDHLIKGVGRTTFDCGRQSYWDDGLNPSRVLNLDNIPWIEDCVDSNGAQAGGCQICTPTDRLDCDKIRLAPLVQDLAFRVEQGNSSGQILNGAYYVVGAYLLNGQRVTDYSLPSNVQPLFTHQNAASSLDIHITEADEAFDEFELILVQFTNFNTVARQIGIYSTRQKRITLDTIHETLPTVDPGELLIRNPVIDKSDAIYRNGQYLLRQGPSNKFDFNYQPLANQITSKWVSIEYPADYYEQGGSDTGHMRDEVYPYFVRWVFNTGDKSASYHIPGRPEKSDGSDKILVGTEDAVDGDTNLEKWRVYNTAGVDVLFKGAGDILPNGGVVLGGGDMAYWESSEFYDDDQPIVWNSSAHPWSTLPVGKPPYVGTRLDKYDLCGKRIRHHKFPDNATDLLTPHPSDPSEKHLITNHYDPVLGDKIRIMGVQFDNIQPPVDNDGNVLTNVAGYEILRGSREGNKTVLAKGMINNLREYSTGDTNIDDGYVSNTSKTFLYPNYPYNATEPDSKFLNKDGQSITLDHFLSSGATNSKSAGLKSAKNALTDHSNSYLDGNSDHPYGYWDTQHQGNVKKDLLTFHSPETNFRDPFLSAKELKVYGELHGTMIGKFQFPKDHPKHKFVTNTAFLASAIVGIGYAMISTEGEKRVIHESPQIDFGGTYTQLGVSTGTTGLLGPSAASAATMIAATTVQSASDKTVDSLYNLSLLSLLTNAVGVNSNTIRDAAKEISGKIAGAAGGMGSKEITEHTETPWSSTPDLLRAVQGIPAFLTYWGEGVDNMLNIIYAFTPYRQFALQQISHCFYSGFGIPEEGEQRRTIETQQYLNPELQDFGADHRINNIYRSRTVALKIGRDLKFPDAVDDTQAVYSDVWDRETHASQWKREEYINEEFERSASSHYVAIKQRLNNQYGQLSSIIQVPVSTDTTPTAQSKSNVLFNGDVYIGRYTEKNTMFFFYEWLKGQPDGAELDYKLRKMITHPRFWMNTEPFDVGEFLQSVGTIFEGSEGPPSTFDVYQTDIQETLPDGSDNPAYLTLLNSGKSVECNCEFTEDNCKFGEADIQDICVKEEIVYQLKLYKSYIEECACYKDDSDDGCGGDDPSDSAPYTDDYPGYDGSGAGGCQGIVDGDTVYPFYDDTVGDGTTGCSICPDWNNADNYIDEGKKKWARKLKSLDRKITKAQKKLDKAIEKLYDEYIEELSGQDEKGFFARMFDGIQTPSDKYAFDMKQPHRFRLNVKEAYMYLFNSGVRDFFVESEINLAHRDWGDKIEEKHFNATGLPTSHLPDLFSTDHIKQGNYYKYDYSLSIGKLYNNYVTHGSMQTRDYDPSVAENCYAYNPKRLMYSLPQAEENKKDYWRVFLPNNYKDFTSPITSIKPIGKNGAMLLFENESPVQFAGVDTLQTDGGTKITIGDGGLFSQPLQHLVNAEYPYEHGSCQNRLSAVNTPMGFYYMSQNQGKVFRVTGNGLDEISNEGMKFWFANYMPYQLTQDPMFDNNPFELLDNPVVGIGCQTIFDNKNQIVFFCKKDWVLKPGINAEYSGGRKFKINGILEVDLGDPAYFDSASWTVSYDPKTQNWIGYHDWHPDLVLASKNTYMTTKANGLWIHADTCESYCNFYGIDHPFEVEYTLHTDTDVNTLRNAMYIMEVYKYNKNCEDRFHVLDFNFDEAVVHNSEQCSGLLRLNNTPKNNLAELVSYPKINSNNIDILYAKEEHKYRFNQFWDITDDRGEFNANAERSIFNTQANGYIRDLNANNLNYNKFALERKKFRHYQNSILLRRRVSGNKNMIVSLAVQMNLTSSR